MQLKLLLCKLGLWVDYAAQRIFLCVVSLSEKLECKLRPWFLFASVMLLTMYDKGHTHVSRISAGHKQGIVYVWPDAFISDPWLVRRQVTLVATKAVIAH